MRYRLNTARRSNIRTPLQRITETIQVLRHGLPAPPPTRGAPEHHQNGTIVDYTPLPYPPQGQEWEPEETYVAENHRDYFTRGQLIARVVWSLAAVNVPNREPESCL